MVTIKDIAQQAGVAKSTVSRYLNGGSVSKKTKAKLDVIVKDGQARLKEGGNLAGSILKLNDSVRNMFEWGIVSQEDALRMASYSPAKSVDIDNLCGQIIEGFDADFIIVDEALELQATYLDGIARYTK